MVRPSALTTPAVTVGPPSIQSGLPIATTVSPTASLDEAPSRSTGRPLPSILRTARSLNRSAPTLAARKTRPSVNANATAQRDEVRRSGVTRSGCGEEGAWGQQVELGRGPDLRNSR